MSPYRVSIDLEAVEFWRGCPRRDQELVIKFLSMLSHGPGRAGDYTEHDSIGRRLQECVVGGCAVTWWPDHAVREIRVVALSAAD